MVIYLPFLICLVGLLMYVLSNGKVSELGRLAFAVGLLVGLFLVPGHAIRLP